MTTKTKPTAAAAPTESLPKPPSKSALVLKLLGRAKGATIAEIEEPTGWQPHTTRAYLSGLRKKGRTVIREQRKSGETAYRIVDAASLATVATPVAGAQLALKDSADASGVVDSASGEFAGTGIFANVATAAASQTNG